jgi:hypothetical protein
MEEKQEVCVVGDPVVDVMALRRARRMAPVVAALSAMASPFADVLPGLGISRGRTPNRYKAHTNGVAPKQGPETRQQRRARERAERKRKA